jgi:ABC-type branched-subunit amino acid transport system ATPase component
MHFGKLFELRAQNCPGLQSKKLSGDNLSESLQQQFATAHARVVELGMLTLDEPGSIHPNIIA